MTTKPEETDLRFMTAALALARRGLGCVWPNPAVGCLLVRPDLGSRVVGRGWTQPGGRPHAEAVALAQAGDLARGATAYVSLEPCAHYGQTPPCADALVAAGISRAVIATGDPDARVAGRGIAILEKAGIEVTVGLCAGAAEDLNAGFFLRITKNRPLVTLKAATTLDGRIATAAGESKWITGADARRFGHHLRATHDAILVGIGTVLADDPDLTCRLSGLEGRSPVRVVLDSGLRLPPTARLVQMADVLPTWVACAPEADPGRRDELTEKGVSVIETTAGADGRPAVDALLARLAERGITRLLIEGGGTVAAAFLAAGPVDRIAWFRAPAVIGGDGLAAIAAFGLDRLADAPAFERVRRTETGGDVFEEFRRRK